MRRTKIIATLGPATDQPDVLKQLFTLGVDVFRVNYSHQTHQDHARRVQQVRTLSENHRHAVAVIADLQGPKVRIQHFNKGRIELREGSTFTIDAELETNAGDEQHVGVSYKSLPRDVRAGDTLLIDDGRIILLVEDIHGHEVDCKVIAGGELTDNKGINVQGGGLAAQTLSAKDRADLAHAVSMGADYIAVSFTRTAEDVHGARQLVKEHGGQCGIIAKIERSEALDNTDEIIIAADAIMIARGDLGVEIGYAALPPVQKKLIARARALDRVAITATQMMESMIDHQMPTRAEVFDVANAVLDGTDAVMLSAETSIGHYPVQAVQHMAAICEETEKQRVIRTSDHRINQSFGAVDEAIAMSTMYAANHSGACAIIAVTETGGTCLWMSRISSGIPIYALTPHEATRRRVTLYRGVYPVRYELSQTDSRHPEASVLETMSSRGLLAENDIVIITYGDTQGRRGGTNNMKIVRVGDCGLK